MSGWKLYELRLVNFCQYEDRAFQFRPGLNVICGPNRSGKSNLLAGIRICLTGKSGNAGVKRSDIREGADGASYVELCLDAGDCVARITRGLRGRRSRIVFASGQETISGDSSVTEWCVQQGFTGRIVNDILLPSQEDLFSFLLATPSVRTQVFQRLLGLDRLAKKQEWLKDHLAAVRRQKEEVLAQLHTDPEAVKSVASRVAGLEQRLASLPDASECQRQMQELVAVRAAFTGWQRRLTELQREVQQLRAAVVSDEELDQIKQLASQYRELSAKIEPLRQRLDSLRQQVDLFKPQVEEFRRLRTAAASDPGDPPVALSAAQLRERIAGVSNARKVLETALRFSLSGTGSCPVCDRPMQEDRQWQSEAEARLQRYDEELAELGRQLQARSAWEAVAEQVQRSKEQLERVKQSFASQGISDPELYLRQLEGSWQQAKSQYDAVSQQFSSLASLVGGLDIDQVVQQVMDARSRLSAAEQALQQHMQHKPAEVTEAQVQEAKDRLSNVLQLRGELEAAKDMLARMQRDVDRSRQLEGRLHRLERWEETADRLASLLKWDQVPQAVMFSRLQRLCDYVNSWLQPLQADFHVRLREDLGFEAYTQGVWQPAERLSGGQKVMLAVSFRLAIAFSSSPHAFMAMDEPTTYLDAEHLEAFRDTLGNLHNLLLARGNMLLLVTHDEQLIAGAEEDGYHVIQLP